MPDFYFRDGNGVEHPINLEACSRAIPQTYHATKKSNGEFITFHRDSLITKFTPEEVASFQRQKLKQAMREAGLAEQLEALKESGALSNAS